MRNKVFCFLACLIILTGCAKETLTSESTSKAKIIIESVIDKSTRKAIKNATLLIHVEREDKEGIVYEDFDFSEYVIEGEVGDFVSIEVNAPGYVTWKLAIRFKKPGIVKFPIEMEPETLQDET